MVSYLGCYLGERLGDCYRSFSCLPFSAVHLHSNTAKVVSLLFTVSKNMDSKWFLVTAQAMNLSPISPPGLQWNHGPRQNSSLANTHQHGFRLQQRPWTSACPSVVTWATDINTDPGCRRTTNQDMALNGSLEPHHHGLWEQHKPLRSACALLAAWPVDVTWFQAATWTTDTHMS